VNHFSPYLREMRHAIFFFILIFALQSELYAQKKSPSLLSRAFFKTEISGEISPTALGELIIKKDNPRLVAILLNVSLGMFGAHRMYLGTDLKVPILYTVTMGGGAVVWLIDLGLLIASSDITPFMNNPHFFMWTENEATQP
jgi:TM2 domain-containing membrane protein YozV